MTSSHSLSRITLRNGLWNATGVKIGSNLRGMFRRMWSATKISTIMVRGATIGSTGTSGFRMESLRIGLLIAMGTGRTLLLGDGRGSKTNLGDLRRSIMGAGLW